MKTFNDLLEDLYTSEYKVKKVLGPDGKWHDHKLRPHRIDFKASKMHGEPAQKDSGEDVGMKEDTTPYWKKASFNKRMSQLAKQERLAREKKEAEKKTVKEENMTIDEQINEVLSKDATAGDWIHDFVHSDNPKFAGKSKEKRKEMALAAYYAKQQNEAYQSYSGPSHGHAYGGSGFGRRQREDDEGYSNDNHKPMYPANNPTNRPQHPVAPVPDRKYIKGTPENKALKASRKPINGHPTNVKEGTMKSFKEMIQSIQVVEEVELTEANHREFASQGLMHPDMAKHMKTGQEMDFYHSKTGDKISGVVKHTADGEVHIKANKDGKLGAGEVHKFKVSSKLNEAKKDDDVPFDGPYKTTKGDGSVKDKSGAVHTPMSRARDLARQAMKKQMKEEEGLDLSDEQADALMLEALTGNQHKLDKNKNGKVDSGDLKMLRGEACPECGKSPCECGTVKESDEVETRALSFGQFMSQLNEYTPGPGGVTRVQGRSYGAQYRDPEGDDDAEDKKKQVAKSEPAVKRGRGRPAGSKSGANQKVTTGKSSGFGYDSTGFKLHLPNSNR